MEGEGNDAGPECDQPLESTTVKMDPGSPYFDKLLMTVSSAYHKERPINSSAFIDSILHNAHFFVLFALYIVCRYVNQISLYQGLLCLALTPLFLYFYINHAPFLFLEEDIKWIRREIRLLRAISKDIDYIMLSSTRMAEKAHRIWGSDTHPSGVTIKGLDKTEAWLDKAKSVVLRANVLDANFDKQTVRRDSDIHSCRISFHMMRENFQQIEELFSQTKWVRQDISDCIKEVHGINMCASLERSRSNIISLQDRPLYEVDDQQKWVKSKGRVASTAKLTSFLVEKINHLIAQNQGLMRDKTGEQIHSIKMQLLLLDPFLKDIQGIRFESEIEEVWLEEVEEIIKEAHPVIANFLQKPVNRAKWLSIISDWKARRKLKRDIRCIDSQFAELLERKDRYGFKFIKRDSSKLLYQSPYQTSDSIFISSLNKMRSYLNESGVLGEVLYEVTSLCNELENIRKLVDDAGTIEGRYHSRKAWLDLSTKIVQSAEKSVETFMKSSGTVWRNHLFKTGAGIKLSREIDHINQTINLFVRCIKAYDIELREELSSVVGLDEDILTVVSQLTSNNQHGSVVSILGIGGIGKTTLAKKIYGNGVVVNHFPCRAWVSVCYEYSDANVFLEDAAKQILKSLKVEEEENHNASLIQKAHDILKEKRYLLVVDNMQTLKGWDILKSKLPITSSSGSRILLTSRNYILADSQDSSPPHQLRLRTKEESWKLFNQIVHFPPKEKMLAKEILGKCGGLPLSILRIGYLMSEKDHVSTAEDVLQRIRQNDAPLSEKDHVSTAEDGLQRIRQNDAPLSEKDHVSTAEDVLQLIRKNDEPLSGKDHVSTAEDVLQRIRHNDAPLLEKDHVSTAEDVLQRIRQNDAPLSETFATDLPPLLSKHLSYFKLFPKDFEIPARRLVALWIAEDLVKVSEGNTETFEDVANKYLLQLIDRGMIQAVERKHNGEIKTCCLPYALQKVALEDISLKRVTDHFDSSDPTYGHIHGEMSSSFPGSYRDILSILSFDTREGNKPGEEIGNFLRKGIAGGFFLRLLVLDLERVFRPELPNTIGKLSKLRYLGLRWTYLESIPASIGNLHNLQTLDVKHTYVHTLPSSIWKLQKLRHLHLNQSYGSKFMRQQDGSSLTDLQTLQGVFVDKDSPLKEELDKLTNLRKLGLAFQLHPSEQGPLADRIVKLKHLQSLRMRSVGEMGEPSDLIYMPLSALENLSILNLFGKLVPSNSIIDIFPKSLTDLTLSSTSLSDDPMPKLENLPNLKVVCFYSNSYTGKKMTCSKLRFPQLVVLKLWKLEQLEDWDVEENAMRNLRELEIRYCNKLNVPSGLTHLKTLTELKLTNMPKEFAATIAQKKGKLWDDLIHSPTVIAVNWEESTE